MTRHFSTTPGRVVVLELAGADAGDRVVEEHLDALVDAGADARARDPLSSSSAFTMLSIRSQNDEGITGSASSPASSDAATRCAGFNLASVVDDDQRPCATRPRKPLRDFVQTIARQHRHRDGATRTAARDGFLSWKMMNSVGARNVTRFEREVVRVLEHAADRAAHAIAFDQVHAAQVVEDARATAR